MNTVASFRKGDRVKFLHSGYYRHGTVQKVGRKYVTIAADFGAQMQLYPYVLQHLGREDGPVDLDGAK